MQINQYMACTDISTCAIVRFCRRAHIFYGIHCAPKTRVHRQEQVGMTPNMMRWCEVQTIYKNVWFLSFLRSVSLAEDSRANFGISASLSSARAHTVQVSLSATSSYLSSVSLRYKAKHTILHIIESVIYRIRLDYLWIWKMWKKLRYIHDESCLNTIFRNIRPNQHQL